MNSNASSSNERLTRRATAMWKIVKQGGLSKLHRNRPGIWGTTSTNFQKYKVAHPPFSLSAIGPDDVSLTRNINDNPRSWRSIRGIWDSFCPLFKLMPASFYLFRSFFDGNMRVGPEYSVQWWEAVVHMSWLCKKETYWYIHPKLMDILYMAE